jgi:hypothetical protein
MVVIHLCVKLSVSALFMAMSGILKFPSLKTIYTHAIQHFYYVSSNSEHFKFFTCFVATAAILKFLSHKIMCTHVRQNFWKVSSNSKHHSKPTMNINLQHHNLLGNQISPKSEDFCIWLPFCTLVTMATAAILNFFQTPKAVTYYGGYSYEVDHNMAPKPWISIPNIKISPKSEDFCILAAILD